MLPTQLHASDPAQGSGLAWLEGRILLGMKAGLANIHELCGRLGNPHLAFGTLHVAGSNGKGSVASLLAGLSQAGGKRTGLFTSPHLVSVRERIRVDGDPISATDLEGLLQEVCAASEGLPITFFEAITAAALLHFQRRGVERAVLEVGLGGRLDSTNVCDSPLSVITGISREHTEILGPDEETILREKAGVLRPGGACVHALQGELRQQLESWGEERGIRCVALDDFHQERHASDRQQPYDAWCLSIGAAQWDLGAPPPALFQRRNRALAVLAASEAGWLEGLSPEQVSAAIAAHRWWGRLQTLQHPEHPDLVLDGAHNPEACIALGTVLPALFGGRPVTLLIGAVRDKELEPMLEALLPHVARVVATRTPYPRFRDPQEIVSAINGRCEALACENPLEALQKAWSWGDPVLACGSLYLLGELVTRLREEYEELAWFRQFGRDPNESR